MKILHFTLSQTKGGQTQYILNLWNHIDHNRFKFDFVTFSKKLDFEDDIVSQGCKVYHLLNYPEDNIDAFSNEFNYILHNNYDVIEIHTSFWRNTIVEELAKKAGIRGIIIHGHASSILDTKLRGESFDEAYALHKRIKATVTINTATNFWACSRESADWLFPDRIARLRTEIINNSIDTERFRFNKDKRELTRSNLHIEGKKVVGYIGRLASEKNIEFTIDVFDGLRDYLRDIFFIVVGDGVERERLKEYVENRDLQNMIAFVGRVDNTEDYYSAMDLFYLASSNEGFPLSLLEAQANGLPCIVSLGVPKDALVAGLGDRLLFEKKKWIEASIKYLNNKHDREQYADLVKRKGYDIEEQAKIMEKKYLDIIR